MLKSKDKLLIANLLAEKATSRAVNGRKIEKQNKQEYFVDKFNYYYSLLDEV